jgi:hypothetical protein
MSPAMPLAGSSIAIFIYGNGEGVRLSDSKLDERSGALKRTRVIPLAITAEK